MCALIFVVWLKAAQLNTAVRAFFNVSVDKQNDARVFYSFEQQNNEFYLCFV